MAKLIGTYGHGTHNDFVLVADLDNKFDFKPAQIRNICNRKTGIGADGFIRVTKDSGKWFMDYRNADGSLAEMCGNGIRVMARFLIENKLQNPGIFSINTRAGMKYLAAPEKADISVNMGKVEQIPGAITVSVNGKKYEGVNISVGNPHAVVEVSDLSEIGDLKSAPVVEPADAYPDGVNVEFIKFEGDLISMRVFERGVGETQSCGTGTCAVALAASVIKRKNLPAKWQINPPGGKLIVEIDPHSNATLIGPAVLVKQVELDSYL
jgi:diaminopimelate epimerase